MIMTNLKWRDSTEEERRTVDLKVPGSSMGGGGETTKINRSSSNQCYDSARPETPVSHGFFYRGDSGKITNN